MNKHVALSSLFVMVVGGLAFGTPASVSAATSYTSTMAVRFTMPKTATVSASHLPAIDFSSTKVSEAAQDVTADHVDAPITVTNPGFANAWRVSVAASNFTSVDHRHQIRSAQLTFDATATQSDSHDAATTAPMVTTTTVTTGGDAVALVKASSTDAAGSFKTTFASSAVHLHIPAGNVAGRYAAQLQWVLTDAI